MVRESQGISDQALEKVTATVRGQVIKPSDAGYDAARAVYNGMIDKRPALVVRCVDVADVMAGVKLGGETGLPVAVRGGGHNAAGLGTCDDGIVLDLGPMKNVRVDAANRRVRVGGGAVWGDVDHATAPFGLAVPAGVVSTTGVGGLTLGGGFGHISRGCGLTCDNLVSADVVLADGTMVTASANEHPDLFWALRGGGGNFGAVTSFEFQAHPVSHVYGGVLLYELEKARQLLELYREFIVDAPRELGLFFGYTVAPPAPFIPESVHLRPVAKMVACYNGPEDKGAKLLAPFRAIGPNTDFMPVMPLAALNSAFDALFPPGFQDYWKADYDNEISDAAIAVHLEHGPKVPNPNSVMHLYSLNGAIQDRSNTDTAYAYRDAPFIHVMLTEDGEAGKMPGHIAWVKAYWDALRPHSAGGAYVNFLMDEGGDRVRATYRGNYERLRKVKKQYDPNNLFRVNQNITPAG
jgi:FAD/FMN-containing dehydrogenase